jgi:uncharacterized protein YeaO (DUF488 family)
MMPGPEIRVKRVYEPRDDRDGFRVLVDRVWPRGMTREKAAADMWLKEVAPSAGLRLWFGHEQSRWKEFRIRYFRELDIALTAVEALLDKAAPGPLTLLYSARDEKCNQAAALKEYLDRRIAKVGGTSRVKSGLR